MKTKIPADCKQSTLYSTEVIGTLEDEVRRFEPQEALDGGVSDWNLREDYCRRPSLFEKAGGWCWRLDMTKQSG